MSNEIDIEKLAKECAVDDYFSESPMSMKEFAEAYHKTKCEQSEVYAYCGEDFLGNPIDITKHKATNKMWQKPLYTTPPDQTAEIERLKAREARLLEALKDLHAWIVVCGLPATLWKSHERLIKEIEAENE